ncbi:MAG: hypothetical protein H6Q36_1493 [Chloroflexi bacterium]|nr:hypothetical protein [Chloroflexota bacterium]
MRRNNEHAAAAGPGPRPSPADGRARRATLLAAVAALLILAGCAGPAPSAGPATPVAAPRVTVTLGIYSGRPDPSWELDPAQSAALVRLLASLPAVTGVPPEGGLGYRGFGLVIDAGGQAVERLVAYRGAVAAQGTGARQVRTDPTRSVERLLLETGRSWLTPAEITAVEADLGSP